MLTYYLGIDTGGTFTDGVLLDPHSQQVVKTGKVLTTPRDLKVCISQIIDLLLSEQREAVSLVSLSTTLATNAIVEGKSRPVGLFLLGYDPALVYQYEFQKQFGTPDFSFITGGMDLEGREQAPLDLDAISAQVSSLDGHIEAYAVSSFGGSLNGSHEDAAAALIASLAGKPVVEGHHLSSRLDSIRRATTASLNASLLSTAYDFLHTVQTMLSDRDIHCPLIVVRGDGSLVNAAFASQRPVEIIHSGPATSASGGIYLAGVSDALVVDIGGTTTDLALLKNGRAVLDGGEASVGGYRTSVRTIQARSFGLGGDSQIQFDPHGSLAVGPSRVIPLSYLAQLYPQVVSDLQTWLSTAPSSFYSDRFEYWLLRREPLQPFRDERTNRVIELLREGPQRLSWLLKQVGAVSPRQLDADLLIKQDIISRAGLTPTDLLHVTGEYTPWQVELACQVVAASAAMLKMKPDAFIQLVRDRMTEMILAEILSFLSGHPVPEASDNFRASSLGRWLFEELLSSVHPILGCQIQLKVPLVGIGAPARAFLPPVARALHTEILFPPHYEVANAVGTVVGNVFVQKEAEVIPLLNGPMRVGFRVVSGSVQREFSHLDEAVAYARRQVSEAAALEAQSAGASSVQVDVAERIFTGDLVFLTATAVGKPAASSQPS